MNKEHQDAFNFKRMEVLDYKIRRTAYAISAILLLQSIVIALTTAVVMDSKGSYSFSLFSLAGSIIVIVCIYTSNFFFKDARQGHEKRVKERKALEKLMELTQQWEEGKMPKEIAEAALIDLEKIRDGKGKLN